jgi:hypothetical protein
MPLAIPNNDANCRWTYACHGFGNVRLTETILPGTHRLQEYRLYTELAIRHSKPASDTVLASYGHA